MLGEILFTDKKKKKKKTGVERQYKLKLCVF